MSEQAYENYANGVKNDPTQGLVTDTDMDGKVILDLGDRAKTVVVDDGVDTIQLLNKLIETSSTTYKDAVANGTAVEDGFGIHVSAEADPDQKNFQKKQIAVWEDDAQTELSIEMKTLIDLAKTGGDVGSESDINLRIGTYEAADGQSYFEIIVDGQWSSDIIRLEGAAADAAIEHHGGSTDDGEDGGDVDPGDDTTDPAPEGGPVDFVVHGPSSALRGFEVKTLTSIGDFNGDGYDDVAVTFDAERTGNDVNNGNHRMTAVLFGSEEGLKMEWEGLDENGDLTPDSALINGTGMVVTDYFVDGETPDFMNASNITGLDVQGVGDVNGDGLDDIVVSTGNSNPDYHSVIFGTEDGHDGSFNLTSIDGTNGYTVDAQVRLGWSNTVLGQATPLGDTDGDGVNEMAFYSGSWTEALMAPEPDETDVFHFLDLNSIEDAGGTSIPKDKRGIISSVGDINGDGFDDVAVTKLSTDTIEIQFGAADGVLGDAGGFTISGDSTLTGGTQNVKGLGDINGDGIEDFGFGYHTVDENLVTESGLTVIYGRNDGVSKDWTFQEIIDADAAGSSEVDMIQGNTQGGTAQFALTGENILAAGDVNNDGYDDIFLDGKYLLLGSANGISQKDHLDMLDGTDGFIFNPEAGHTLFNQTAAGDVNGDGIDDLIGIIGEYNRAELDNYDNSIYGIYGGEDKFEQLDLYDGTLDGHIYLEIA